MEQKISIVMAYHNRKKQLQNTLDTMEHSEYSSLIEVIIVDDGSLPEHRIEDLTSKTKLDLNIIRIEPENKTWINSCIPYNIGFKQAKNDIVIIQNPECLHFGDIIKYSINNIRDNVYLNYGCYSTDKDNSEKINTIYLASDDYIKKIEESISPMNNRPPANDCTNGWYNHSVYIPRGLHFCSAIMRKDLLDLGGFDERYANGIAYDDDDLILRIRRKGMEVKMINDPFAVHQYHKPTDYEGQRDLFAKNRQLFISIANNNRLSYKVNV